jgi:thiosulfate/3-mercaptopyruvate sulfurtransferase
MDDIVVSPEWLAARLDDEDVVVVDVRDAWEFDGIGHVPGAVNVPFDEFRSEAGDEGMLPGADAWRELLSAAGVDADDALVAYDDTNGVFAARFLVTALAYGHRDLHLLDGDYSAWARERPTTTDATDRPRTAYEVRDPVRDPFVDYETVRAMVAAASADDAASTDDADDAAGTGEADDADAAASTDDADDADGMDGAAGTDEADDTDGTDDAAGVSGPGDARESRESSSDGTDGAADVVVLDTREEWEWEEGHLPGAVQLDWREFVDEETRGLRPDDELAAVLADHGVTPGTRVLLYCNTARRISHTFLVLAHLGYEDVSFYEGSLTDWTARGGPVERAGSGAAGGDGAARDEPAGTDRLGSPESLESPESPESPESEDEAPGSE